MSAESIFQIAREVPFSELEQQLRDVTLLNQPDVHPYEEATISIERFEWHEVMPTARYVETGLLAVQRRIRQEALALHGQDQLELEGGLIVVGGELGQQELIPPIVEQFDEVGPIPYILDGSHRTFDGRARQRESFLGLFIRGIRKDCPPYAFPNLWNEVHEVAERPADKSTWKNYRDYDNRYALYRDYGPINGSVPRGEDK
jgi:hypothetical protein